MHVSNVRIAFSFLGKRLLVAGAIVVLNLALLANAFGDDSLTVGAPTVKNGQIVSPGQQATTTATITVQVYVPGVQPQPLNGPPGTGLVNIPDPNNPGKNLPVQAASIPVQIPARVNGANITATGKANAIANAINGVFGAPPNVATVVTNGNGTASVNLTNGVTIKVTSDKTGEQNLAVVVGAAPQNPQLGLHAFLDWDVGISGLDTSGGISDFTASFGYDGLTDTATLGYNQLTIPTLDGLVSQMYSRFFSNLPMSLRPELILDLADDQIVFDAPEGTTNVFMNLSTTDTGVELDGGVATVTGPEPGSLLLLFVGLLTMAGISQGRLFKPPVGSRGLQADA